MVDDGISFNVDDKKAKTEVNKKWKSLGDSNKRVVSKIHVLITFRLDFGADFWQFIITLFSAGCSSC